jgi:hypothetical protein
MAYSLDNLLVDVWGQAELFIIIAIKTDKAIAIVWVRVMSAELYVTENNIITYKFRNI